MQARHRRRFSTKATQGLLPDKNIPPKRRHQRRHLRKHTEKRLGPSQMVSVPHLPNHQVLADRAIPGVSRERRSRPPVHGELWWVFQTGKTVYVDSCSAERKTIWENDRVKEKTTIKQNNREYLPRANHKSVRIQQVIHWALNSRRPWSLPGTKLKHGVRCHPKLRFWKWL